MTWLRGVLVGLGIVVVLIVVIVLVLPRSTPSGPSTQSQTMTVGDRTVTVAGHYKNLSQESTGDRIKIIVDGHEITIAADQLTMDGKTEVLDPDQDVTIYVDDKGGVEVKLVREDSTSTGSATE